PEDEKIKDKFYEQYTIDFLVKARDANNETDPVEKMKFDIKELELKLKIDGDNKEIIEINLKENAKLTLQGTKMPVERETTYQFSNFNEAESIDIPDEAVDITD